MEIVIKILQFAASLSLLVFVHELGHFLTARMFGVRVEKFYIFFPWGGFSLLKFKIGETQFGIGWVPFGGYCKIAGMVDESLDLEQMAQPPKSDEFRSKPAWQRLIIMTGGVIMNVILAAVIYIGITYTWGERYVASEDLKFGYTFSQTGQDAGFRNGDRIVSVDGRTYADFRSVATAIVIGNAPEVVVERDGRQQTVEILPRFVSQIIEDRSFISPRMPFVVGRNVEGGAAQKAGLLPLDSLVAVNGVPMLFYDEYQAAFREHKGVGVELTVARDSAGVSVLRTVTLAPDQEGRIGVYPLSIERFVPVRTRTFTLLEAIPAGIRVAGQQISDYWKQLKMVFNPRTKAYRSIGGFITIGSIFPDTWNWFGFWSITALLSIVLAVMNILPIPLLDGGHVVFLLWEVVTRRRVSDKVMEVATYVGFFIVIGLLLLANANDVYRLLAN